jgi:hypothetical protein
MYARIQPLWYLYPEKYDYELCDLALIENVRIHSALPVSSVLKKHEAAVFRLRTVSYNLALPSEWLLHLTEVSCTSMSAGHYSV